MGVIVVCLKYNTSFINSVSLILSVSIVLCFSIGIRFVENNVFSKNTVEKERTIKIDDIDNIIDNQIVGKEEKIVQEENEFDWYIEIPKIRLYAPIEEGTDDEVLNRSVGHFENTSRRNGNCGLAAHNRGYRVNYFARVKELEEGDAIYYFVDEKKYEYQIIDISIIYETDWSMLEDTEDNRITLITCVENREEYRLCVQGVLIEK
ncbi:MAG: class D sortase [Clostridia bacterium]|nr:class D sortase [Clostridia bacterium]